MEREKKTFILYNFVLILSRKFTGLCQPILVMLPSISFSKVHAIKFSNYKIDTILHCLPVNTHPWGPVKTLDVFSYL